MKQSLSGIEARLDRAVELSDELRDLISAHFKREASGSGAGPVVDHDPLRHLIEVRYVGAGDFPLDWSVRFGELLYLVRSSLDHLVWLLVTHAGGTPTTRTQFPIFVQPTKFSSDAPRMMKDMTPAVQALIETLQPFVIEPNNPDTAALWLLHNLCNIDKHRALHLSDAWLMDWKLDLDPEVDEVNATVERPGGVIVDGDVIVALELPPATTGDVAVSFTATMSVGLRDHAGLDDQGDLAPIEIGSFVHGCVHDLRTHFLPQFEPHLP